MIILCKDKLNAHHRGDYTRYDAINVIFKENLHIIFHVSKTYSLKFIGSQSFKRLPEPCPNCKYLMPREHFVICNS